MRLSNKWGLPETLVRATSRRNDDYDAGPVHRSASALIKPPQIDLLRKRHYKDIETDVTDEFWSLFGSAVHHILQMGAGHNDTVEERLFAEVDGWSISGAIDMQEGTTPGHIDINDYKVCSVYSLTKDSEFTEWTQQLNIYRWLVETNKKVSVDNLSVIAILRDWQRAQSRIDILYPPAPIVRVPIQMWSMAKTETFIRDRIALHRHAEMMHAISDELPECTDEERWVRDSKWAVIKKGGKRAHKVLDTEEQAKDILDTLDGGYIIEHRPGKAFRCQDNFCQVSRWCKQWAKEQDAKIDAEVRESTLLAG